MFRFSTLRRSRAPSLPTVQSRRSFQQFGVLQPEIDRVGIELTTAGEMS